jgi:hypothetical protein
MALDPNSRRQFLAFLAGSPLLAAAGLDADWLASQSPHRRGDTLLHAADELARYGTHPVLHQAQPPLIAKAADALDVFDFEPVAKQNIPVAHWGYLMTGTDDDATIAANRAGFDADAKAFIFDALANPPSVRQIASMASGMEQAAELYLAARLAINPDQPSERAFLEALAHAMNLPPQFVAHLEQQVTSGTV